MAEYEEAQTLSAPTNLFLNCFNQFDMISDSGIHEKTKYSVVLPYLIPYLAR